MSQTSDDCVLKKHTFDKTGDTMLSKYNQDLKFIQYQSTDYQKMTCPACLHDVKDQGLEELAQQISHELRTPLNAVIGFSDIMRKELFGPVGSSRYHEYLGHISESAQRMLQVAEEALCFTSQLRIAQLAPSAKPLNLSAIVCHAALHATKGVGQEPGAIEFQISHSIEIWGRYDSTMTALTYLFRSCLLEENEGAGILVLADFKDRHTLLLSVEKKTRKNSLSGFHKKNPDQQDFISADAALFKALAFSLLKHQNVCIDHSTCDSDDESILIELELSEQQAFML